MKYLWFAALTALCSSVSAFAQTASLTSDTTTLSSDGGQIVFTAIVSYDDEPGALGWSIDLPANWSLASVVGPNVPAISPEAGTAGTLEFAYLSVPTNRAEFSLVVRYPAGARAGVATPTVLVRSGGKLTTLKPAPIALRGTEVAEGRPSRN